MELEMRTEYVIAVYVENNVKGICFEDVASQLTAMLKDDTYENREFSISELGFDRALVTRNHPYFYSDQEKRCAYNLIFYNMGIEEEKFMCTLSSEIPVIAEKIKRSFDKRNTSNPGYVFLGIDGKIKRYRMTENVR